MKRIGELGIEKEISAIISGFKEYDHFRINFALFA